MRHYRALAFVEMMIVIAIIGIIASVTIASFQPGRSSTRLKAAQREIVATIKLAQSYALNGKKQGGTTPCGYGFRFSDSSHYEIFYNPRGGSSCVAKNSDPNQRHYLDSTNTPAAESFALSNNVTLNSLVGDTEIYFTIPHANVYDEAGSSYLSPQTLTFIFGGATKTITINPGGYVNENN